MDRLTFNRSRTALDREQHSHNGVRDPVIDQIPHPLHLQFSTRPIRQRHHAHNSEPPRHALLLRFPVSCYWPPILDFHPVVQRQLFYTAKRPLQRPADQLAARRPQHEPLAADDCRRTHAREFFQVLGGHQAHLVVVLDEHAADDAAGSLTITLTC